MPRRPRAVDLFAGAGGLSLGLSHSFDVVAAVERDKQAGATYAAEHPHTRLLQRDVMEVAGRDLTNGGRARVDLLSASPPCQGFSIKGSRRHDHPGNAMLRQVVRLVHEVKPLSVLVENVVGLRSLAGGRYLDELLSGLSDVPSPGGRRYDVHHRVLNAAEYGVPQVRRRLFVVAVQQGAHWRWPPVFTQSGDISVWDALRDLPEEAVNPGETVPYPRGRWASLYGANTRRGAGKVLNHHTKPVSELRAQRMQALQQGQNGRHLPPELAAGGHDTKYRRLRAHAPAPTLTAHMDTELTDFIHPYLPRSITAREAARLQGFHDRMEFLGSPSSQFRQIGNAVPVPLAEAIGRSIAAVLRQPG